MSASSSSSSTAASTDRRGREPEAKGPDYHCDYCRKDITSALRIKCAECKDFDLCLECFSEGVEVFPHKNSHKYRVVEHVVTPIFEEGWGADEELLLLEAIELYGLGNWSDVADHVGTKTKVKCEQHYNEVYLGARSAPLPDLEAPLMPRRKDDLKGTEEGVAAQVKAEKDKEKEEAAAAAGLAPGPGPGGQPSPVAPADPSAPPRKKTDLGHLVGYVPNRGEFETEYDNDAELILADMEFKEEDTKRERDLKLKILEIYNTKLDAREERKKFIFDRGLLYHREKRRTKEEREVYNTMRVFARFHSKDEHEQFVQGLINEQRLRKRIEQLQQMRLNGIRTLADGQVVTPSAPAVGAAAAVAVKPEDARTIVKTEPGAARKPKASKDERSGGTPLAQPAVPGGAASSSSSSALGAAAGVQPMETADFDLPSMPGFKLLSTEEKKLCNELRIIPQHYLVIKERLVRECFARGLLKPAQARQLLRIDINKTDKIFDFFVSAGWVHTQPPPSSSTASASTSSSSVSSSSSSSSSSIASTSAALSAAATATAQGPTAMDVTPSKS